MLINASVVCYSSSLATTYYALRSFDKSGQGWTNVPVSSLTKLTGLSASTFKRHVSDMKTLGWVQSFRFTGDSLFVKYVSEKKIVKSLCKQNLVKEETNTRYVENKANLKKRDSFLAKALLAVHLRLQRHAETKLNYKMDKGKVEQKDHVNQRLVREVRRDRGSRLHQRQCSHSADISNPKQSVFISLKNKSHLGSVRVDRLKIHSVGISQKTLSKVTGYSTNRISKLMKVFADKRIRCFRRAKLTETFDNSVATIDLATDTSYESIKPLPYYYEDRISHQHYRATVRRLTQFNLTPQELEVAKLSAITMGYPYSKAGAIKAVEATTLRQFRKNTRPLRQLKTP